ncbi:hypothetical protein L210DRAFT_948318 [Boletus edulis BED1]|uniref:Uncharacterized protein n=1 Tax=Boletus edulis BED1 TaxID=1328754 RepID=A0AAD4BKG6_BOLED|nr:hypothetical protein L210DRAFT_948318 [Boletus edulis BED1]
MLVLCSNTVHVDAASGLPLRQGGRELRAEGVIGWAVIIKALGLLVYDIVDSPSRLHVRGGGSAW